VAVSTSAQAHSKGFSMQNFWCAARLIARREAYATHCLGVAGFQTYLPRLRERRTIRGRKVDVRPPLFPGYIFILIVLQWHAARWAPGVAPIIMDGMTPAEVPDRIIDEIRSREVAGLVELPKPQGFRSGDRIRITSGPFEHHLGLYAGQGPRDRVEVLLRFMGAQQRTELPASAVEAVA
jgi:transcriptional antiterminator RfaH